MRTPLKGVEMGEAGDLEWATGGNAPWIAQSVVARAGDRAAHAGGIDHNGTSWLQTEVLGLGALTFWWRVSSEDGFDGFRFLLDGVERHAIDGNVDWQQRTITLERGEHVLYWSYEKDDSVSELSDTGWLDEVVWRPDDFDNDALPDGWEIERFDNLLQSGTDDSDADGQNNAEELAGFFATHTSGDRQFVTLSQFDLPDSSR